MALLQKKKLQVTKETNISEMCMSWTREKLGRLPGIYEAAIQKGDR